MNDSEDQTPGLDDPKSVSLEVRIARYEAYLTEWLDFKTAVHMAASISILSKDTEDCLEIVKGKIRDSALERVRIIEALDLVGMVYPIAQKNTMALISASKKIALGREKLSLASAKSALVRADKLSKDEVHKNWTTWQESNDRLSVNEWKEATSTAYGVKVDTLRRWHEGWKRDMKKA